MSLKIYGIGASRASRPIWAALELGLAFEHSPIHYQGGTTRTPEFLALNPMGHISVIADASEQNLCESPRVSHARKMARMPEMTAPSSVAG